MKSFDITETNDVNQQNDDNHVTDVKLLADGRFETRKSCRVSSDGYGLKKNFQKKYAQLKLEVDYLKSASPDVFYKINLHTKKIDYISPNILALSGFSPEEMEVLGFENLIIESKVFLRNSNQPRVEMGKGFFQELLRNHKNANLERLHADHLFQTKSGRRIWVEDYASPWIDSKGIFKGYMGVLRDITERMLMQSKMIDELQTLANTDSLTGLSNRRVFFNQLDKEICRIKRTFFDISIILLDIDFFKRINDEYGHDAGDCVLVQISDILRYIVRETDISARIGGEEFGIILLDTNPKSSILVAQRIKQAIENHQFAFTKSGKNLKLKCTASIGCYTMKNLQDVIDATPQNLYKKTDELLYQAKRSGRNCIVSNIG